jgi:hypothetical protein
VVTVDGVDGLEGFTTTPTWIRFHWRDEPAGRGS